MAPMLLNIHHGYNFRDLGGYQTKDGHKIQAHRLIRSAALDRLSPRDQQFLADYGVRYDVDFRSKDEQIKSPDRLPVGVEYVFDPVFSYDKTRVSKSWEDEQQDFANDAKGGYQNMLRAYQDMITTKAAHQAYRQYFDLLLANHTDAVLFHCSAGKDRTGMGAVFLLAALGVDPHTIRQDYMATNDFIGPLLDEVLTKAKNEGANANMLASLRDLWIVRPQYLDTALATIREHYGDMATFLKDALGLNEQQQQTLKKLYLA